MFDDGYLGVEQHGVGRALAGGGVIDVYRVDSDEDGPMHDQPVRAGFGQMRVVLVAVAAGAPVSVPSCAQEHGTSVDSPPRERRGPDRPVAVDDDGGQQGAAL